jgi:hypothetical protein
LLQAGIAATPVVMTVVSRPVLANGTGTPTQCQAPSGFVSGNTSSPGGDVCAGRTPGYWKTHQSAWPSGYYTKLFSDCFSGAVYPSGTTLSDVVNMGGGPPDDVGRHIVAALCNTLTGIVPTTVLSVAKIQSIWSQYISTGGGTVGYYSPGNNVKWDHTQICDYLVSTMPL